MFKQVIRLLLRIKPAIKYCLIYGCVALTIIISSNFIWIDSFHYLHVELSPTIAHASIKQRPKNKNKLSKKQRIELLTYAKSLTQTGHKKLARGESSSFL